MGRKPIVERKCQAGRRVGERSNIKMATENIFTKYEKLNRAEVIVNILNESVYYESYLDYAFRKTT